MRFRIRFCKRIALAYVVFCTLLSWGCGTNRIMNADFNLFNPNTTDAGFTGNLPGLPDGDSIEGPPHFLNGSLSIAVNGPGGGGNNLRIVDVSPQGIHSPAVVSFIVADHVLPNEYRIVWEGVTAWEGVEGKFRQHTEVLFLDEVGLLALRLTLLDGPEETQQLLFESGTTGVEPFNVNSVAPHEILITIHPNEGTVGVRYENSGAVQTRQNLSVRDREFGKLKFVRFGNFSPNGPYYLSHVNAVAKGN